MAIHWLHQIYQNGHHCRHNPLTAQASATLSSKSFQCTTYTAPLKLSSKSLQSSRHTTFSRLSSGSLQSTSCSVLLELYGDNGKENGNYYSMPGLYRDQRNFKGYRDYSALGPPQCADYTTLSRLSLQPTR